MTTSKVKHVEIDGQITFYLNGNAVGHLTRGDTSGVNTAGRQRVTWYGELTLPGWKRTFKPSGAKSKVFPEMKRRCRKWESEQQEAK